MHRETFHIIGINSGDYVCHKRLMNPVNRCKTRARKISQFRFYPLDAPI